jgi:hypothetical protein
MVKKLLWENQTAKMTVKKEPNWPMQLQITTDLQEKHPALSVNEEDTQWKNAEQKSIVVFLSLIRIASSG